MEYHIRQFKNLWELKKYLESNPHRVICSSNSPNGEVEVLFQIF